MKYKNALKKKRDENGKVLKYMEQKGRQVIKKKCEASFDVRIDGGRKCEKLQ